MLNCSCPQSGSHQCHKHPPYFRFSHQALSLSECDSSGYGPWVITLPRALGTVDVPEEVAFLSLKFPLLGHINGASGPVSRGARFSFLGPQSRFVSLSGGFGNFNFAVQSKPTRSLPPQFISFPCFGFPQICQFQGLLPQFPFSSSVSFISSVSKMPPRTRRMAFPKVVIARDTDSEQSSSSSSEEEEDEILEEMEEEAPGEEEEVAEKEIDVKMVGKHPSMVVKLMDVSDAKKKEKTPITISLKNVCKVCKRKGHQAGFKGATYIDCPMKPCFLCKMPGHTTITCPHRVAVEHGVVPEPLKNTRRPLNYVFERQLRAGVTMVKPAFVIPNEVVCAVIRYHSRRITCLEFHPTNNNILLSGDKKGQLGVWDYGKVYEKTVYGNIHSCILNNMRFNPSNDGTLYAASSDGTVSCIDLETGMSSPLMDLNPDGWQGPGSWRMLYGMDINPEKSLVLVADNFGYLYLVDIRSNEKTGDAILIHKKGSKVVGLHCNPVQPEILLSCGNDHFARIWDVRRLEAGSSLYNLPHSRVVNSAYFSPQSGSKILTTSQDNRLRVWDYIFGNLDSPSREIVHSHDFNRHLTPFRAEWDPKDPYESLAVIGRYISENYNGAALHPIDFIDTSTGQLVAEVMEPNITTISPVNKLHPRDDVMATGSSRSIFIWKPKEKFELVQEKDEKKIIVCGKAGKTNKKFGGESDDDSDGNTFSPKGKKSKIKKPESKSSRSYPMQRKR